DSDPGATGRLACPGPAGGLAVEGEQTGWLRRLEQPQLESLTTALVGLYKLAGVDVVRDQVQAGLAGTGLNFAVEEEGLAVRSQPRSQEEIVLPMYDTVRIPLPAHPAVAAPVPPVEALIFARIAIYWA